MNYDGITQFNGYCIHVFNIQKTENIATKITSKNILIERVYPAHNTRKPFLLDFMLHNKTKDISKQRQVKICFSF